MGRDWGCAVDAVSGMVDKQHILVVDDHREICDLVQEYLSSEDYRVSIAHDGAEMRRLMAQSPVDLIILDLMLPGEDGLTLARWLRENSRVGIIMLTGRVDVVPGYILPHDAADLSKSGRWVVEARGTPDPSPRKSGL